MAILPPKPKTMPVPPKVQVSTNKVQFGSIDQPKGQRILLYGSGGIGKTTLACLAPGPVAFLDCDESLHVLQAQLKAHNIPLPLPVACNSWEDARNALQASGWEQVKTIVIDTATKLEEMAVAYTLKTVKREGTNPAPATSLESYGYGKGYRHLFETFQTILADLETHIRAGRNVILIAHDCTSKVPNPSGEDWIRYEPRLTKADNCSIRLRLKEWCDHVLFVGYDVNVKEKRASGSGTRTLYTAELPTFMAKSRTTTESFDIELGKSPWLEIIK